MGKVLIVDDDQSICQQCADWISAAGHKVLQAHDGGEGVEIAKKNLDIDIVVTDYHMQLMDGDYMVRQLRQLPPFAKTPVFILTTEVNAGFKSKVVDLGIKGWILKPAQEQSLVELINVTLRKAAS